MNTVCVEVGKQKEKKSYADDFARIAFLCILAKYARNRN